MALLALFSDASFCHLSLFSLASPYSTTNLFSKNNEQLLASESFFSIEYNCELNALCFGVVELELN